MRCLLFVVRCLLVVVCCLLCVVWCLLVWLVVCLYAGLIVCCLLIAVAVGVAVRGHRRGQIAHVSFVS